MTPPVFIDTDSQAVVADVVQTFQDVSGRTVAPGQPEWQVCMAFAAREITLRMQIQSVGEQSLVDFANGPALDALGAIVGVARSAEQPATAELEFTLPSSHGGVIIPAGTRVASDDGKVIFATISNEIVTAGTTTATVDAICQVLGTVGNGYAAGTLTEILDPQPYLNAVENTDITSGGSDAETDEQLRARIKLAPSTFSVAGSVAAYKFWTYTASPLIIDVAVISDTPGEVQVYPLVDGGTTPTGIITDVENTLTADRIRPLTDTVIVDSPTVVGYDITVDLVVYDTADPVSVKAAVITALTDFKNNKAQKLGRDIKISQIIAAAHAAAPGQLFDVEVTAPSVDVVVDPTEVGICGTLTVNNPTISNG